MRFRLSSFKQYVFFFLHGRFKTINTNIKDPRTSGVEVNEFLDSSRYKFCHVLIRDEILRGRSSLASGIPGLSLKITGLYSSGTLRCITGLFLKAVKVLIEPMGYLDH